MFSLGLRFRTPLNLLVFLLVAELSAFWIYLRLKNKKGISFAPVIVLNAVLFIYWAVFLRIAHDESTHLHLSWLISQGLVPYKDFWHHHSPFLWAALAGFFKWLPQSIAIIDISRIFSGLLFLANAFLGWQIARRVWQEKANGSIYLLVLSSTMILGQVTLLRPDIFMTFLLLAMIYLCLGIPQERIIPSFLAGICFSLAASFIVKQYLLFLLPLIAVSVGEKRRRLWKITAYFSGLIVGILPLLSYLWINQILKDYLFWVFFFNKKIIVLSVYLPLLIVLLSCWGAYLLWERYRRNRQPRPLILFVAFCLSSLSSLTSTMYANGGYYLLFWFFMAAITASGCPIIEAANKIRNLANRSRAIGLVFGILLVSNFNRAEFSQNTEFFQTKETVTQLMDYCLGDACFILFPSHPIFAKDATRFYSYSQYLFLKDFPVIRDDITGRDIAACIQKLKPAVVSCNYLGNDFLLELFQKNLIKAADYKRLVAFFRDNYTQKLIGSDSYYIRNDKLKQPDIKTLQ